MEVIQIPLLDLGQAAMPAATVAVVPRVLPSFRDDFGIEPKWAVCFLVTVVLIMLGIIIWLSLAKPAV